MPSTQEEDLATALSAWREQALADRQARLREPSFATDAGIPIQDLYTPEDLARLADRGFDYLRDLGFPGEPPFTRGVQATMYRGRHWTMRQYAGFGTAAESNRRYRYLLEAGQTGLSVAFDLPTQMGRDSDHPLCAGEVGRTGVAIDSIHDMRVLFDGIPLERVSTSMTINATAAVLLALYVAVADERGVARAELSGTVQNDILKEYIARGTYIYPPGPSLRLTTDLFAFCRAELPKWNTISISGYHIREAGSDAVQEVAFTLADGLAYVAAAIGAGLAVDDFAPRLAFFFGAHNNLLEEVAKFRAARRLWARLVAERFVPQDPRSRMLRFHTQTAGCTLTAQQPENNIVRVALQALAAVLGGTQSLHTNSFDEALALPSEDAARLALRTQQLIAHESGVTDFVDPLAGSYAVETLTSEIETRALALVERIDQLGGMVAAIEAGFPQREIQRSAYACQRAIESGQRTVVGVNRYQMAGGPMPGLLRVAPEVENEQRRRLAAVRAGRDQVRWRARMEELRRAASTTTENLLPAILGAVKAEATVGEVTDTLAEVFGHYRERVVL